MPVRRVADILAHAIQEMLHQFNQIVEIKYKWDLQASVWEDLKNKLKWSVAVDESPKTCSGYGMIAGISHLICRMAPRKIQKICSTALEKKVV